jgi:cholesterol oxidase
MRGWRVLLSFPAQPYQGAAAHTQTHLVMAHDDARGRLVLSPADRLRIEYPDAGRQSIFKRIEDTLEQASKAIEGIHLSNPIWDRFWSDPLRRLWYRITRNYQRRPTGGRDLLTVHPLGGCAMAEDAAGGVVNHKHQVFRETSGTEVYDSLYVCDGAVVPRSLGANPLLTIAGLAERACVQLLEDRGLDPEPPHRPVEAPASNSTPRTLGLRWAERLTGWVSTLGNEARSSLSVVLDTEIDDLDHMIKSDEHEVRATGVAIAPALFEGPAMVVAGSCIRLLVASKDRVNQRDMIYRLKIVTQEGEFYEIHGEKFVNDHWWPIPLWRETTTLYTRVYAADGQLKAFGIIRVGFFDFLKLMYTQRAVRPTGLLESWGARFRFNRFFMGQLLAASNPAFAPPTQVPEGKPRQCRPLEAPPPQVFDFPARDGVMLQLTRYASYGAAKGPVILSPGLGVSSRIFTLDTIPKNLVEFLCDRGYDVWLLDYRASIKLPASATQFTGDDVAKNDYPAAVDFVLAKTGSEKVQFMVHCFGANTFFMSVLGGYLDASKVRCAVVSQIATHLITSRFTALKAGLYVDHWANWLGKRFFNTYTDDRAPRRERAYNFALRFLPWGRSERCRSDVCHRISLLYSPLYQHDQLYAVDHDALYEMFGRANISTLGHLLEMSRVGHVVDSQGGDTYIPHMKRLDFPIRLIHGAKNRCYDPLSTRITLELLQGIWPGSTAYDWKVIPGYGHIDCMFGRNAAQDVYPYIVDHLDRYPVTDQA